MENNTDVQKTASPEEAVSTKAAKKEAAKKEVVVEKVRIKLLRDSLIEGQIVKAGAIVAVDKQTAVELCDTKFPGYHPHYGNTPAMRPGDDRLSREVIVRAERVP